MSSIKTYLQTSLEHAFEQLGYEKATCIVNRSDRPDLADYQCNGALGLSKKFKKNPRELAQEIINVIEPVLSDAFECTIAGPGFLNFKTKNSHLSKALNLIKDDARLGDVAQAKPQVVVIDFSSPNVAKPMHVGHLRSTIIGDSLQRIIKFKGDQVKSVNHLGDWGSPMGMLISELKRRKPNLPYFQENFTEDPNIRNEISPVSMSDLEEMYPIAALKFKESEEEKARVLEITHQLQQKHKGYFRLWKFFASETQKVLSQNYLALGIHFDYWMGESSYEPLMGPLVEKLKKDNKAQLSQGAWIIPFDDSMPPVILVKSGGGFLYHTSDLACIMVRKEKLQANKILYVVDKRQSMHFKQVFRAAYQIGIVGDTELKHITFGTMNGSDQKPFKTREGSVLKLSELIQMVTDKAKARVTELGLELKYSQDEINAISKKVGIATLKFADLKNARDSDYVFDLEQFSKFEGFTGPYLLYAAVRIKSILRKADESNCKNGKILEPSDPLERALFIEILKFSDVIDECYFSYESHHLCRYVYDLAQAFNSFYKDHHILNEKDLNRQMSWLSLSRVTLKTIEKCLELIGIEVPERM